MSLFLNLTKAANDYIKHSEHKKFRNDTNLDKFSYYFYVIRFHSCPWTCFPPLMLRVETGRFQIIILNVTLYHPRL